MQQTRRAYLGAVGAAAVGSTGLAGCLGGGSGASDTSHSCELTERESVDELSQPRVGPADAAVTVEVFEDFACPHCATFATGAFSELKPEFADDDAVAFVHYDFPIPVSDWSGRVANAARSVQDAAGDEAFFAFSEAAYAKQDDYSWQVLGDVADEAGVDPCRVLSDASNGTYGPVIQANREEADSRGVPGTPAPYVNGTLAEPTYDSVSSAIAAARDA